MLIALEIWKPDVVWIMNMKILEYENGGMIVYDVQ